MTTTSWEDAVFYHLYPLGACGAPRVNDLTSAPVPRLEQLGPWLRHAKDLGASAVYLGPVFESLGHGYDTVDLFRVDRRLGTDATLAGLVGQAHELGLAVVLDAVFGHVGRRFFAFEDLRAKGEASAYRRWFRKVDFTARSRFGDPFGYEYWSTAPELPRLDQDEPEVRAHLLAAVDAWVERYHIDGLRLDTADWLPKSFLSALRAHVEARWPGFFLVGEVVHGDYGQWVGPGALHSVTNYELFKGLWSSHVDHNFFEVAHTLNRQFGPGGVYRGRPLYTFADNHDVDRVASLVKERAQLFSLWSLVFTVPGVPSIYAGSEFGLEGRRTPTDDRALRPQLDLGALRASGQGRDLREAIARLARVRAGSVALRRGDYRQLSVSKDQLAFVRQAPGQTVVVVVNGGASAAEVKVALPDCPRGRLVDLLDPDLGPVALVDGRATVTVPATWARVLELREG